MNVLLIGGGGREHAIAKAISKSKLLNNFYAIPGNPGIAKLAEIENIPLSNLTKIVDFAQLKNIDLIICGPEVPLVDGLADLASSKNIPVFGPKKSGAWLEGSKIFSKNFMKEYNIPTADFTTFDDYNNAKNYFVNNKNISYPIVIKADGLAAGKGVVIAKNKNEALGTLKQFMIDKKHGSAGTNILIEEFLPGEEMSLLYITDGKTFLPLIPAKDYKKAFDNDQGENTGGMGSYAPHQSISKELTERINKDIIEKIKIGMTDRKMDYRGVLYVGIILSKSGPKVLEFNCRFGDPETQVILPLLENDFLKLAMETAKGNITSKTLQWKDQYAFCIVLASGGYPQTYKKNIPITFDNNPYDYIHAGTKLENDQILTNGGRVLNSVALGNTKEEARQNAYELIEKVSFNNSFYRKDIGN